MTDTISVATITIIQRDAHTMLLNVIVYSYIYIYIYIYIYMPSCLPP